MVSDTLPLGREESPMNLNNLLSVLDFEKIAKRRLPGSVYSYIAGGSEEEASIRGNRSAFESWAFLPRVAVDVSRRNQQTALFGIPYSAPFGIAPMGGASVCRFEADLAFARAAQRAGIPFVLSGASTVPLEKVFEAAPTTWFQAYIPPDRGVVSSLMERLRAAGVSILVITIDVPIAGNRERYIRRGFSIPMRYSKRLVVSGLARPRWLIETFAMTLVRSGIPRLVNYSGTGGAPIIKGLPRDNGVGRAAFSWADVRWIREEWRGRLIIKGLLHPKDAATAEAIGADGIIVSNHGGRQLDYAVAPIQVLPSVAAAVKNLTVMIDGGFRRGTDILKALVLGARFVLIGRPAMYGLAVAGERGVDRVIEILKKEVDISMALTGCPTLANVSAGLLVPRGFPASPKLSS
jgi:L-lactate dehydrogenase (cytochrome)